MSEAVLVLDAQGSFVTPEARGQEASSEHESLDDDEMSVVTPDFYLLFIFNF